MFEQNVPEQGWGRSDALLASAYKAAVLQARGGPTPARYKGGTIIPFTIRREGQKSLFDTRE